MANVYYISISNRVNRSGRVVHIVAESFHDAYGLARGVCKNNDEIENITIISEDVLICPQVAKDAAKHA